jgi:hypothetical protein
LQTLHKYILFVELANKKYVSCDQSGRLCLTDNPLWNRRSAGSHPLSKYRSQRVTVSP